MKTIPPPCLEPETGKKYWRGLDQLADTPEFRQWMEREFPQGASEFTDPVSRRHFVKIMSASFLLAGFGVTGCRRPVENILPFAKQPEDYIHGVPQFYATAMPTRGGALPLLVRSSDGRPTKIEGNPDDPACAKIAGEGQTHRFGGTDHYAQASVLNLYDPDRATRFAKGGNEITREAAFDDLNKLSQKFVENGGEGLSFLLQRNNSPSRARLLNLVGRKYPKARWHVHEPVDFDVDRQAASIAFGKPVAPQFKLSEARVIVSLDCDFIGSEENTVAACRDFVAGRKLSRPTDTMNRLYVVEALMTLTGANADHRLRVANSEIVRVAGLFAEKLLGQQGGELVAALKSAGSLEEKRAAWVAKCAEDLLKPEHRGKSLVVAGHRQPMTVHLMAHAINAALGNVGTTVVYHEVPAESFAGIADLANDLNGGKVDTLVILGGNPVYDAPAELDWKKTQRKAKTVVRWGYHEDETGALADYHFPATHFLESWGDARAFDGSLVSIQPLIEPLFGGITELEFLARVGGLETTRPHDIVRETFKNFVGEINFEEKWKKHLHDGFLANSAANPTSVQFNSRATLAALNPSAVSLPTRDNLEIVFHRDYKVDDGRWNNNGWLQELPDPITKLTWENLALVSSQTAKALGIVSHDIQETGRIGAEIVKITFGGRTIEAPVWIQPGLADNVITLPLGYGRERTGRIGHGSGFNAYALRTSEALHFGVGAKVTGTGVIHDVSCTQSHWSMEGRPIIREANLSQYTEHPDFAKRMNMEEPPGLKDAQGHPLPLYPNPLDKAKSDVHQWGMSIDLNSCVGCGACMMACQSENNVPIVGKLLVGKSREMHWLRIDRYFAGPVEDPQVVNQPMMCQHCEAAPCESVCPVNATVHDQEGLNVMVYNRCVGTRYCSNNCPWKVRRFNYFDYNRRPLGKDLYKSPIVSATDGEWELKRWFKDRSRGSRPDDEWELIKLVKNPDVTVRMRGVMEKCTFCVQRIEQAKIAQKVKAGTSTYTAVPDGSFTTACAQACPTDAIVFGNVLDGNSRVSQLKELDRDYTTLEFLNTKPRLTYLAKVRNPNPDMPDYYEMPLTSKEYTEKAGAHAEHTAAGQHEASGHKSEEGAK